MSDSLPKVSKLVNANTTQIELKNLRIKLLRWRDMLLDFLPDLTMPTSREIDLIILETIHQADYSYVYTHEEEVISAEQMGTCFWMVHQRMLGTPMAYVLGYQEFYGRKFTVDSRCLIPRPETEVLIDMVKVVADDGWRIFDVGTGSGCIAVTLSLELPGAEVIANDKFRDPLKVARENNRRLKGKVSHFVKAPTLSGYTAADFSEKPFVIVANLPYVNRDWKWCSDSLQFEPQEALYADESSPLYIGTEPEFMPKHDKSLDPWDTYEIEVLFKQIALRKKQEKWNQEGYVAIEADVSQLRRLKKIAESEYGLKHIKTAGYASIYQI